MTTKLDEDKMKEEQQHYKQDVRRPHDDSGHHQNTTSDYVKPRIQAIERRVQLRTPDPNNKSDPIAAAPPPTPDNFDDGNLAIPSHNKNTTANTQLVLHSTVTLSSILPNPNIIKQFESDLLKKQAQYSGRISDLDGRLATFHTRLAVECAERGREHAFTMEEYVDEPLERAMRRSLDRIQDEFVGPIMDPKRAAMQDEGSGEKQSYVNNEREAITNDENVQQGSNDRDNTNTTASTNRPLPNLVAIERRTNLLEAQMNHHAHVTLFHSKRHHFDVIDKSCRKTLQPALVLEMTKADKREGKMVRRFESSSGEYARLVSEMTSSRVSSLGYIEKQIENLDLSDLTRAENYLEVIQKLKQIVSEEREARIKQDKLVVERIVKTKKMLEEEIFLAC